MPPSPMSFCGGVFISLFYNENNYRDFFVLSFNNWALMLILASICTAYVYGRESDEKLSIQSC
jgi:hypothetical protein